ncbi:MAG: SDR family NAD(P)-dependent oxidoreductase [Mycobacteriales bacterium]
MESARISGSVALVTGGANGIGEGIVRRLAGLGAKVVIADIDTESGEALAEQVDGHFVHCDVGEPADNEAAVGEAVSRYGGLHIVALNAGVATDTGVTGELDPIKYRRAMAINLDGVVYGAYAARSALRESGGGDIIVTASIAGLLATPLNPVYGTNKAAVVGLVRALGPMWQDEGIRVNALCPGFADTAMIDSIREMLAGREIPILDAERVVDGFLTVLTSDRSGQAWPVLPGLPIQPFPFAEIPGFRSVYPDPDSVRRPPRSRSAPGTPPHGKASPSASPGRQTGPLSRG